MKKSMWKFSVLTFATCILLTACEKQDTRQQVSSGDTSIHVSATGANSVTIGSIQGGSVNIENGQITVNGRFVGGSVGIVGTGPVITQQRTVPAFNSLMIEGAVDVFYSVAPTQKLEIEGQANVLEVISTTVVNGQLVVTSNGSYSTDKRLRLIASGPSLSRFTVSGSSNMHVTGLTGEESAVEVSGSSDFNASGSLKKMIYEIHGSAEVDGSKLIASDVVVDVSGSASVTARAIKSATIDVSGSGSVTILGNPTVRSVERSGSASVQFK